MVAVVAFKFSVMRCQPLRRALVASSEHCVLLSIVIDSAARGESLTFCC